MSRHGNGQTMRRGFVTVDGRRVHARAMGRGPVLVMLHECPRSSRSLVPLMRALAERFCCIALDTPGYGLSDPLPERFAGPAPFAATVLGALDALGIDRAGLYGTHTGAAMAVEAALTAPKRVAALVLDGPPAFTERERDSMLAHYLPPLEPVRDGSHLTALWSRVLDQHYYFPFYDRRADTRMPARPLDLVFMTVTVLGFADAGDHYRDAYRMAITYPTAERLARLTGAGGADGTDDSGVPVLLCSAGDDLLAGHLERLAPKGAALPPGWSLGLFDDGDGRARLIAGLRPLDTADRRDAADLRFDAAPFFQGVPGENAQTEKDQTEKGQAEKSQVETFQGGTVYGDWIADDRGRPVAVYHRPGFGQSDGGTAWPPEPPTDPPIDPVTAPAAAPQDWLDKDPAASHGKRDDRAFWRLLLKAGLAGAVPVSGEGGSDGGLADGGVADTGLSHMLPPLHPLSPGGGHVIDAWFTARTIVEESGACPRAERALAWTGKLASLLMWTQVRAHTAL
ncbi:alpha/beta fold hydrolase [Eilatimonas milleporae]|uniref:Pimeloyl-ACP methyl ester carboxylesterase n=1 Tax=Eilatimonas milleporae TaxID=911205 RepID=A0A3M0CS83_9PROT|nr:alpha/beta hydrolase [Eilatimonas milleporae]RMB12388.1 pimeloyl-ACP methyl ester carboxylesterase [Eilatimonas milleporae]